MGFEEEGLDKGSDDFGDEGEVQKVTIDVEDGFLQKELFEFGAELIDQTYKVIIKEIPYFLSCFKLILIRMKLATNKTPIMTIVNGDSNVITKYIVDKAIVNLSRFLISLSNALNTVKCQSLGWYIYHVYYGLFS